MQNDLRDILDGWPFDPEGISARRITGDDGRPKIQLRLDLGLRQMEETGRPDGARPKGFESLLTYYQHGLQRHTEHNGTELGFELDEDACEALRHESLLYYYRYVALFHLGDFAGVERDTARNLQVLDLCRRYAAHKTDRYALEPYRPYILMMNTRARARQAVASGRIKTALARIDHGLAAIRQFCNQFRLDFRRCGEAKVLRRERRRIKERLGSDPLGRLKRQLRQALREERYEDAAKLRDRIAELEAGRR